MSASSGWARTRAAWITAVVVAVGALAALRTFPAGQPPYPLAQMHATATVLAPDSAHVQQVADQVGGRGTLGPVIDGVRQVVGTVRFGAVDDSRTDGQLVVFVIDNRSHTPARVISANATSRDRLSLGWDGRYERLVTKYPWLKSLRQPADPNGLGDVRQSVAFRPGLTGPVTFLAALDDGALPITDPARDLTVVLAYVTDDEAWAVRVPVTN